MSKGQVTVDQWLPPRGCMLQAASGCEVVNQALEDIRQAFIVHFEQLQLIRNDWQAQSHEEFLEVIEDNYSHATQSPEGSRLSRLMELAKRVLNFTLHKTKGSQSDSLLMRVGIPEVSFRGGFDIPRDPLVLTPDAWPFWLEGLREKWFHEELSFETIHEFVNQLYRNSVLVNAVLWEAIQLRQSKSGDFANDSESDLERQILGCKLIGRGVEITQQTTLRIGRQLRVISLAIAETDIGDYDLSNLVQALQQSAGYQQIGDALLEWLAERCRKGNFCVNRSEVETAFAASQNALESALNVLKTHRVLVPLGTGPSVEFWSLPVVYALATYFKKQLTEPPLGICQRSTDPTEIQVLTAENKVDPKEAASASTRQQQFDQLLLFAAAKLTPLQTKAVQFLIANEGRVRMGDLVCHMDWEDPAKNCWGGLRRRVNERIIAHNQLSQKSRAGVAKVSVGLAQRENYAVIISLDEISSGKKQGSARSNQRKKRPRK